MMPFWILWLVPATGTIITFLWWQHRRIQFEKTAGHIEESIMMYHKERHGFEAFLIAVMCALFSLMSTVVALHHGMYDFTMPITDALYSISNSMTTEIFPTPKQGDVLIFFKFGCSDCEAVYDRLAELSDECEDVHYISTRLFKGPELVNDYTLQEVPSAVYIEKNKYVVKILYKTDEDGNTVFDEEAWERIKQLKEEDR